MSHEWIEKNIGKAIPSSPDVLAHIKVKRKAVYSRHLIYAPRSLSCAAQHAAAYEQGTYAKASSHTNHDVPKEYRYDDDDVKRAVNIKKANLRKKYGNLKTLEAEK
jgi:hypothetical protein